MFLSFRTWRLSPQAVILLVLAQTACADNELPTCKKCDACEDSNDECSELTLAAGTQQEFCSDLPANGEDPISSNIEVSSMKSPEECGTFDIEFYLQGDDSKKWKGAKNSQCHDPKVFGMDTSASVLVGSEDGQVCAVFKCHSGQYPCKLMYQLDWVRYAAEDIEKAHTVQRILRLVALGCFLAAVITSALVFFCCLKPKYDAGGMGLCGGCAMWICCFPWMALVACVKWCRKPKAGSDDPEGGPQPGMVGNAHGAENE